MAAARPDPTSTQRRKYTPGGGADSKSAPAGTASDGPTARIPPTRRPPASKSETRPPCSPGTRKGGRVGAHPGGRRAGSSGNGGEQGQD